MEEKEEKEDGAPPPPGAAVAAPQCGAAAACELCVQELHDGDEPEVAENGCLECGVLLCAGH